MVNYYCFGVVAKVEFDLEHLLGMNLWVMYLGGEGLTQEMSLD